MKKIWLLLIFLSVATVEAQVTLPFEHKLRIEHERYYLYKEANIHPVYPIVTGTDSLNPAYIDLRRSTPGKSDKSLRGWLNRKFFYESLLKVQTKDFTLSIDPMVYFEAGLEFYPEKDNNEPVQESKRTWVNTRGIRVDGSIGKQFAFHSAFYESQAVFPSWLDKQTRELMVVPGQGMYKNFKETGFDYAFAEGHISYSPSKFFNFRFGHGKNFIGHGYRSLLLSDAAFSYPYLAINTKVWHFQYTNIYSQHQDIRAPKGTWHPWAKKYSTMHYLSWNVTKWLNIGLFESIIWHASDSSGYRGFELNYLNPVIFYRPVEFSLGSPDNALLGGAINITFLKRNVFYTQLMLDEFKLEHVVKGDGWWANKHGFQVGIKSFDPFDIDKLYIQFEYNHVRPYTYAHHSHLQNYAHYNQSLAHPQGANFREAVIIADKRINRWQMGYKMIATTYGADTSGLNYGHDLYRSYYEYVNEFGNKIGQGLKVKLLQHELSAGWIVNPSTNLILNAGVTLRNEKSEITKDQSVFLWFGLRSSVFNRYYDF